MSASSAPPILTVAVTLCNLEPYILRCLRSIADPAGPLALGDVEVLVVDDGSTDRSAVIAERFAADHPGMRVFRKENAGQGSVIDFARRHASGAYFTIIDGDDEAVPDALRRVAGALRWLEGRGEAPDALFTDRLFQYDRDGRTRRQRFSNVFPAGRVFGWTDIRRFGHFQALALNSIVYRRALLDECGLSLPERTHFTDVLYNNLPLPRAKTLYYVPEPLSVYHKGRPGQATSLPVTILHADDHARVDRILAAAYDRLPPHTPRNLERYLRNYYAMILVGTFGLLTLGGQSDRDRRKTAHLRWLERNHPATLHAVRRRILVWGSGRHGRIGNFFVGTGYKVAFALHWID